MPATAPLLQPCQVRACACWGNYVRTGVGCVAITVGGGVAVVWWVVGGGGCPWTGWGQPPQGFTIMHTNT